jgi:hypothetical protein
MVMHNVDAAIAVLQGLKQLGEAMPPEAHARLLLKAKRKAGR